MIARAFAVLVCLFTVATPAEAQISRCLAVADAAPLIEPAAYTGVGFAGVDAFVFRDLNSNGVFDEGEPVAAG